MQRAFVIAGVLGLGLLAQLANAEGNTTSFVMPSHSDYVSMLWENGPPFASVDDRSWGFSNNPGHSMIPAGVTLRSVGAASVSGDFTTSMTARGRWRVQVATTATNPSQLYGADLMIEGDNGNTFPIWGVNHISWSGNGFYIWPVETNAEYEASMLSDFNSLFPVGTTLIVKQSCTGGMNSGGACGALPSQPHAGLVFETGYFDVNFDPEVSARLFVRCCEHS
jgi:hypothetical protein